MLGKKYLLDSLIKNWDKAYLPHTPLLPLQLERSIHVFIYIDYGFPENAKCKLHAIFTRNSLKKWSNNNNIVQLLMSCGFYGDTTNKMATGLKVLTVKSKSLIVDFIVITMSFVQRSVENEAQLLIISDSC